MSRQPTKSELAAKERKDARRAAVRARRRVKLLNQRQRAYNLSKYPVVVRLPGPLQVTAGQQSGIPLKPGVGYVKRWVSESAARRQREREAAAEAAI